MGGWRRQSDWEQQSWSSESRHDWGGCQSSSSSQAVQWSSGHRNTTSKDSQATWQEPHSDWQKGKGAWEVSASQNSQTWNAADDWGDWTDGGEFWHGDGHKSFEDIAGPLPQQGDIVIEPKGVHKYTLMWFHSCMGRPCHIESYLDDLVQHKVFDEHMRVVAPCSPWRDKEESYQWYVYSVDEVEHRVEIDCSCADKTQLQDQRRRLLRVLETELRRLPHDGRLLLGGLSQGASIVLDLLLHTRSPLDGKLRGAFAKRGMLQKETLEDLPSDYVKERLASFPILATHGTVDDLVPISFAQQSYGFLKDNSAHFQFRRYSGLGHNGYNKEESAAIVDFTRKYLLGS